MSNLGEKTLKGIIWSSIDRFSVQGIQFILSFVIARQLSPNDYGIIAMLSIFIAIAQSFVDSGFTNALIQRQNNTQVDYSTVFYTNVIISVIAYIILFLSAKTIASFYSQPIIVKIIPFIALNLIINALSAVHRVQLIINLDFKKQAVISLISACSGGFIGVYMAYNGYGVWTLIYQTLTISIISSILFWIAIKWKPCVDFSFNSFRYLFKFGSKILIGGLFHTIYVNSYSLIIGKFFQSTYLGYFNRAFSITQYPSSNITNVITRVTYPIECSIKNDNDNLQNKFFNFIKVTSFFIFPMMIGLAALAEPFIKIVLGDKWIGCVPYLRIMCFAYMWDPVMRMSWDLLNVKGRSDLSLKSEIIKKIIAFVILFSTIPFGLKYICCGLILYSISDILIVTQFIKKILPKVTFSQEMKLLAPMLILSAIMGLIVFYFIKIIENEYFKLLFGLIIGMTSYIGFSLIFMRDTVNKFFSFIRYKSN